MPNLNSMFKKRRVVMAKKVTGEAYYGLDGQLQEIKRQLRQNGGYPFDPRDLQTALQSIIEGKFPIKVLVLDRERFCNPSEFLDKGCSIWKGPVDGKGLEGEEDRDMREDALTTINWNKVIFETHLREEETSIRGEKKLKRAMASSNIQLGGRAFFSLWRDYQTNGENSVLEELRRNKDMMCIYFFGLCLRCPDGTRNVLYLRFRFSDIARGWEWHYDKLSNYYNYGHFSASLVRS